MAFARLDRFGWSDANSPLASGRLSLFMCLLLSRTSVAPKTLVPPGPDHHEMKLLIASAMTAPDHAGLTPWRFISIEGLAESNCHNVLWRSGESAIQMSGHESCR